MKKSELRQLIREYVREVLKEDDIRDKKIKNPETGNMIKVGTALGYDSDHPAYKQALKLYNKASGGMPMGRTKEKDVQHKSEYSKTNSIFRKAKTDFHGGQTIKVTRDFDQNEAGVYEIQSATKKHGKTEVELRNAITDDIIKIPLDFLSKLKQHDIVQEK